MNPPFLYRTTYDRQRSKTGLVHIGYGNFHRAHQAVYIDDLMEKTGDLNWGIAAVNLRDTESASFAHSAKAHEGYIVKSIAPDGTESHRQVRPHQAFIDATKQKEAALDMLTQETVKAVTITVTESGYYLDRNSTLAIEEDMQQTIYGYLAESLGRRAASIDQPITILCCDNMRSNGHILKRALIKYIESTGDNRLVDWVEGKVTFPCSMVDRITPKPTKILEDEIKDYFPNHSISPVHAEAYSEWVLEDNFASMMPDLAQSGVKIVKTVEPFEEAKIRMLNGGHSGLAYLGALAGHKTFDEAMRDPVLKKHFAQFETEEVLPGLGNSLPFDPKAYLAEITERFENRGIADSLERICMDGYSKMSLYIRPTLASCLEQGIIPQASFDSIASWVIYARRCKAGHSQVLYHEPYWDRLAPMIEKGQEEQVAQDPNIWGDLPKRFPHFVSGIVSAIQRMDEKWQV